jgi:hypothetical protein
LVYIRAAAFFVSRIDRYTAVIIKLYSFSASFAENAINDPGFIRSCLVEIMFWHTPSFPQTGAWPPALWISNCTTTSIRNTLTSTAKRFIIPKSLFS